MPLVNEVTVVVNDVVVVDSSENMEPTSGAGDESEWTKSAKSIPKKFTCMNIYKHAQKFAATKDITMKPIQRGYKFFFENYVFDIFGKVILGFLENQDRGSRIGDRGSRIEDRGSVRKK